MVAFNKLLGLATGLFCIATQAIAAQSCAGGGGCKNGSQCVLNSKGLIWCKNCPAAFTGSRCEIPKVADGGQSCAGGGGCKNGSQCVLNSKGLIWCKNCPAAFTGSRCEIPKVADGGQSCAGGGGCKNGSQCVLNSKGLIWCKNCPAAFTGNRCEIPKVADGGQSCAGGGGCKNGSQCVLNSKGLIWCKNCPEGYSGNRCEIPPALPDCDTGRFTSEDNGCVCKEAGYVKVAITAPAGTPIAGTTMRGCVPACAQKADSPPLICTDAFGDASSAGCSDGVCYCSDGDAGATCPISYGSTFTAPSCGGGCLPQKRKRNLRGLQAEVADDGTVTIDAEDIWEAFELAE